MVRIVSKKWFSSVCFCAAFSYDRRDERGLEKENTKMVFAYAESLDEIDVVIDKCEALKNELKQDAIALEIDGQMYFI